MKTSSSPPRRGPSPAGLLSVAFASVLLLCAAGNVPVENFAPQGAMQTDLNAGAHSITNAGTVSGTNVIANALASGATVNGAAIASGTIPNAALAVTPNAANGVAALDAHGNLPLDPHAMMLDGCALEIEGDSISAGATLSTPATQCFGYLLAQTPFALNHCTYRNDAVSGSTIATGTTSGNNITDRYAANVKPHRPTANGGDGGPRAYLILLIGTNDLGTLGNSAATVISNLTSYITTATGDGFTVVVSTLTPRQDSVWTGAMETARQTVNAAIRANAVGGSLVMDDDHLLTDPTNTTYFATDKLHWALAGHAAIANYLYSALISGGSFRAPNEGITATPMTAPSLTLNGNYNTSTSALSLTQSIYGYPFTITNANSGALTEGGMQIISTSPAVGASNSLIQLQAGASNTNDVWNLGVYYTANNSASNYLGMANFGATSGLFKFYSSGAASLPTVNATTVNDTTLNSAAANITANLFGYPVTLTNNWAGVTGALQCFSPYASSTSATDIIQLGAGDAAGNDLANLSLYYAGAGSTANYLQFGFPSGTTDRIYPSGLLATPEVQGLGATPTIAGGSGAGTSPTLTITGTDLAGEITITTGTSPTASATIATITLAGGVSFPNHGEPVLSAESASAASLTGTSIPFCPQAGTSTWTINSNSTALPASTIYVFRYHLLGY